MALINCVECGKAFSDKAPACPHCGCPIEEARGTQLAVSAKLEDTPNTDSAKTIVLREYLEKVRILETDIYTMNKAIDNLENGIKPAPQKEEVKTYIPPKPKEFSKKNPLLVGLKSFWLSITCFDDLGIMLCAPFDAIGDAFDTVKKNRRGLKEYQEQMEKHEKAIEAEDIRHKNECTQVTLFNNGIGREIELLKTEKAASEATLKQLYDIGVIYPKYRSLIPITMFCQYMDSKRRTELEDTNGMYDLYETELLGSKIVNDLSKINGTLRYISYQLGGISNQLSGVQRNQVMVYEEVERGNEIASKISQSTSELLEKSASMVSAMSDMRKDLAAIRSTSEMTAYNAKAAANRVDAIAKIEEYEYSLRHSMRPSV